MRIASLIVLLSLMLGVSVAGASQLTLGELMVDPGKYEGSTITLKAEVVGDVMLRGQDGWINVSDGTGSLGVFAPRVLIENLVPGRFGLKGDVVAIVGVFNRSCTGHGGDMDIHASALAVVNMHQILPQHVDWWRYILATVLGLVFMALWVDRLNYKRSQGT